MLLAAVVTAEGTGGSFTDLNPRTAIVTWVAFGITFLVLSLTAWPRLATTLEARELRIAEGIRKAEEAEERARMLAEQQTRLLDEARREAHQLLAAARAEGEQQANALLQSAQAAMADERRQHRQEVAREQAAALQELKQAAVELTLLTAAHLMKRDLAGEEARRAAQQAVEDAGTGLKLHRLSPVLVST